MSGFERIFSFSQGCLSQRANYCNLIRDGEKNACGAIFHLKPFHQFVNSRPFSWLQLPIPRQGSFAISVRVGRESLTVSTASALFTILRSVANFRVWIASSIGNQRASSTSWS